MAWKRVHGVEVLAGSDAANGSLPSTEALKISADA